MSDYINKNIKKYSLEAFVHNINNKLCLYIGGGLKGSETICQNRIHDHGPYCEHHYEITHKRFVPMKEPVIKE